MRDLADDLDHLDLADAAFLEGGEFFVGELAPGLGEAAREFLIPSLSRNERAMRAGGRG